MRLMMIEGGVGGDGFFLRIHLYVYIFIATPTFYYLYTPPPPHELLACSTNLRGEDAVELVVGTVRVGRGGRAHRLLPHLALVPVHFFLDFE